MPEWFAPHQRRRRVVISSDTKNEADDQFTLVHALLSPSLDVRALVASHFGLWRGPHSMAESRAEMDLVVDLLGMSGEMLVLDGAPAALTGEHDPAEASPGARFIAEEAMRDDDTLFVVCLGPLTDMALALKLDPRIADRDVVVVWIGGESVRATPYYYPEFNLGNDVPAANMVFDSGVPIWQIPVEVFVKFIATYTELEARIGHCGPLGRYLVDQLVEFNQKFEHRMEHRILGNEPAVMAAMVPDSAVFEVVPAPRFGPDGAYRPVADPRRHTIRRVVDMDTRFCFEDLYLKIAKHAAGQTC